MLAVGTQASAIVGQGPELELFERERWEAPADFAITGAAYSSTGAILLWSGDPARVVVLDTGLEVVTDVVSPTPLDILAVGRKRDGGVEIFTRNPDGVTRTSLDDPWSFRPLELEGTPSAAAHDGSVWYVWVTAGSPVDRARIVVVPDDGAPTSILDEGAAPAPVVLTATDSAVISTAEESPHSWRIVEGADSGLVGRPPETLLDSLSAAIDRDGRRQWRAISTVPLDEGYLQSIADVTSNWRVLVLYDQNGRPLRNPIYRLPMGIFGSAVESASLYAVVRRERAEVIRYEWRWKRAGGSPDGSLRP